LSWLYFALNVFSISIPLAFSFEKRVAFYKSWKELFISMIITATFFITWDIWFTSEGVWKFNPQYISGIHIANLPVEEWMFFFFIPYACMFIHESLKYYIPNPPLVKTGNKIALVLAIVLFIVSGLNYDKLYTSITFLLLGVFLIAGILISPKHFPGRFFFTYLVTLVPFAIVNGILTSMPVLIYSDSENLSFRIGTIPVEDFFYSMLLLLMNITIYEYLKRIKKARQLISNPGYSIAE